MRRLITIERKHLILGFAWLVVISGGLTANGALFLTGGLILTFSLYYRILIPRQIQKVSVERASLKCGFEGQTVEVRLFVRNESRWPIFRMEVVDLFEPDMHPEKTAVVNGFLPAFSQAEYKYDAICFFDRGVYDIGPITVRIWDPLSLFSITREIPGRGKFYVYPEVFPMTDLKLGGESLFWSDQARTGLDPGGSMNYLGVREYRYGDPLRFIHWGQTARRDELMVREHEREIASPVVILADLQLKGRAGTGKESIEEYSVKIVASIASRALQGGSPTTLMINGVPGTVIQSGCGEGHNHRILSALIHVRQKSILPFDEFVGNYESDIPTIATSVLIVSAAYFNRPEIESVTDLLAGRDNRILAVLLDDEGLLAYERYRWEIKNRPSIARMIELLYEVGASSVYLVGKATGLEKGMRTPVAPERIGERIS